MDTTILKILGKNQNFWNEMKLYASKEKEKQSGNFYFYQDSVQRIAMEEFCSEQHQQIHERILINIYFLTGKGSKPKHAVRL
jgi:hypothetical protein